MPAPRQSRRRPPGTYWRGNVLWAKIKVAGQQYRRSLFTDDFDTAAAGVEKLRQEIIGEVRHGRAPKRTFAEAIALWTKSLPDRVGPNTLERYLLSIKVLGPKIAGLDLEAVTGPLIADIIAWRRAAGVTLATIKRDLGALSSVMNFAVDEGWIEANPVLPRLGRLKERRDPITLPDAAHIRIIADRAPGRLRDLILAAWLTGCRQDELASAKAAQFDAARGQLSVVGKGRRRRTLDLSPEAVEVVCPPKGHTWLFENGRGDRFHNPETRWRKLAHGIEGVRAGPNNDGITPFPFHHLRHRFAVDYLKAGRGTIYDLQLVLGHSSVKTTEIYLEHLTPAERHAAMFGGTKRGTGPRNGGSGNEK